MQKTPGTILLFLLSPTPSPFVVFSIKCGSACDGFCASWRTNKTHRRDIGSRTLHSTLHFNFINEYPYICGWRCIHSYRAFIFIFYGIISSVVRCAQVYVMTLNITYRGKFISKTLNSPVSCHLYDSEKRYYLYERTYKHIHKYLIVILNSLFMNFDWIFQCNIIIELSFYHLTAINIIKAPFNMMRKYHHLPRWINVNVHNNRILIINTLIHNKKWENI